MLNPDHSKFNSTLVTPTLHVPCANLPAFSSQTAAQLLRGQPMSSTAVLGFIKDIVSNNLKSVQDRLKATPSQGPNQRFTDPKQQGLSYPLLHKAVEVKSREIVCALIEAGADVNATDSTGRTALCWLASSNSPDESTLATAELLLKHPQIDILAGSSAQSSPLHEAAAHGNVPMLQLLLQHGKLRLQDWSRDFTILHAACSGKCARQAAKKVSVVHAAAAQPACTSPEGGIQQARQEINTAVPPLQIAGNTTCQQLQPDQQLAASISGSKAEQQPDLPLQIHPTDVKLPLAVNPTAPQLKPKPPVADKQLQSGSARRTATSKPTAAAPQSLTAGASSRNAASGSRGKISPGVAAAVSAGSKASSKPSAPAPSTQRHATNSPAPAAALSAAAPVLTTAVAAGQAASMSPAWQQRNRETVDVILATAPDLLHAQDADGFTPLMHLVRRGLTSEARYLLFRGDCNVAATAVGTGESVLHLACTSSNPDMQLVSALLAAGADPMHTRPSDGSSALLLAVKTGGVAGLSLAKELLLPHNLHPLQREPQYQCTEAAAAAAAAASAKLKPVLLPHLHSPGSAAVATEPSGPMWCPLDESKLPGSSTAEAAGVTCQESSTATPDVVRETPVSVAAAAVIEALIDTAGTGATTGVAVPVLARRAAGQVGSLKGVAEAKGPSVHQQEVKGPSVHQQELLALLLAHGGHLLPPQQVETLLQEGLAGRLSDNLTSKVVHSMPNTTSLEAAAGACFNGGVKLSFEALLQMKLYRTAVAWFAKSSGQKPHVYVDAAGNTLMHSAVSGSEDIPDYVLALAEEGVPINSANKDHDTALHIAARQGHLQACQALVAAGADVLRRNGKNRIPGSQLKLSEVVKAYLQQAEEAARSVKEEEHHALWDEKMRATQTKSAYGVRVT